MCKTAIILIAPLFFCVNSQTYPNQNCPVFRYENQNGNTVGRVELENDLSGDYKMSINMSVAAYLTQNENIAIRLLTEANSIRDGFPLVYHIIFPIQSRLPKPTRIEFNQRIYCTGMQETLGAGGGVTNFWASNYLGTGGPISGPQRQPSTTPTPHRVPTFQETSTYTTSWKVPPSPIYEKPTTAIQTSSTISPPSQIYPNLSDEQCGITTVSIPLISGGIDVLENQFPWLAAILFRVNKNTAHKYKCTGSLVSYKHVITAAHCIKFNDVILTPKENILIVFGEIDVEDVLTNEPSSFGVSNIAIHPEYNSSAIGDSDIAVFTLSKPIKSYRRYMKPICIWNEDDNLNLVVMQNGTVAGWGSDKSGTAKITLAAYVKLPIVSQVQCLRSNPKFRTKTSSRTFCAGNKDGKGPCNGDSGAGFIMRRNNKWTLRGIVSRSLNDNNTCNVEDYIIFTDVAKVTDWLKTVLI